MELYLTFVLKSALLQSIFWMIYTVFLKNETFFTLNRWFLMLGILTAFLLPLVEFQPVVHLQLPSKLPFEESLTVITTTTAEQTNYWRILFGIYMIGAMVVGFRFILELLSLKKIIGNGRLVKKYGKVSMIEVTQNISPFSFFNTIVYNPDLHQASELKTILQHENIHISQKHSVDMLLISMTQIILWFNPISWIYKKQLAQNLEYIADDLSCNHFGTSKKDYQYLLLKQLSGISYSVINPFFNSLIKKRIIMLQKQRSNKRSTWKYIVVFPLLAGFMLLFSFQTQVYYQPVNSATINSTSKSLIKQDSLPPLYVINGEKQPVDFNINSIAVDDIESITVLKNDSAKLLYGDQGKNGVIQIILKANSSFKKVSKATTLGVVNKKTAGQPIILVDDEQMPSDFDINTIAQNNIKSIEVIKDKNATAKYGIKATTGIIKIYTKDQKKN